MKITIIGTGYVGLVGGTCLANLGNEVICLDVDKEKIDKLNKGVTPIYEPGLKELIERNEKEKRLFFTTDKEKAIKHGKVILIAVGTPSHYDGSVNMEYIDGAAKDIANYMQEYKVIVNKSTVPVGTADRVKKIIK